MKVEFYFEGNKIGEEFYTDVKLIKIPNLDRYKNSFFYYKFTGKSNTHWSIVNYQINKSNKTIKINLRENTINLSLKELSKNEKKGDRIFY